MSTWHWRDHISNSSRWLKISVTEVCYTHIYLPTSLLIILHPSFFCPDDGLKKTETSDVDNKDLFLIYTFGSLFFFHTLYICVYICVLSQLFFKVNYLKNWNINVYLMPLDFTFWIFLVMHSCEILSWEFLFIRHAKTMTSLLG